MIDLKNKVFLDSDGEMTFENKERLNFIMHFMKQGAVEQVATNKDGTFVREDAEISFNEIWLPCAELKAKQQATPEGSVLEQKNWISVEIGTPAKFGTRVKIKRKSWDEEDNLVFIESEATYDKDSDFCELSNRSYEYETWFDHSLNKYLEEDEPTHWMPLTKEAQEQSHE